MFEELYILVAVFLSALLVIAVGVPVVRLYTKIGEEMAQDEQQDETESE